MAKLDYDTLNSTIRYLMFSVFAVRPGELGYDEDARAAAVRPGELGYDEDARAAVVQDTATFLKRQEDNGVVVRGVYDVAGSAPMPTS